MPTAASFAFEGGHMSLSVFHVLSLLVAFALPYAGFVVAFSLMGFGAIVFDYLVSSGTLFYPLSLSALALLSPPPPSLAISFPSATLDARQLRLLIWSCSSGPPHSSPSKQPPCPPQICSNTIHQQWNSSTGASRLRARCITTPRTRARTARSAGPSIMAPLHRLKRFRPLALAWQPRHPPG